MVKHCHVEGETAACENELFEVMLSAVPFVSQYHSELMAFCSVGCHPGTERRVPAFFKTHTSVANGSDVYTFLSINSFHSLMNVDQRHVFCGEELSSLHTVLSSLINLCYSPPCLQAQFGAVQDQKFKL